MSKIKLYEYDYAAYFTGNIIEIDDTQGYQSGYLTTVEVPEIPAGHYAKFNKSLQVWEITANERPVMLNDAQIIEIIEQQKVEAASQEPPQVI